VYTISVSSREFALIRQQESTGAPAQTDWVHDASDIFRSQTGGVASNIHRRSTERGLIPSCQLRTPWLLPMDYPPTFCVRGALVV
jgi:hypothetical protein